MKKEIFPTIKAYYPTTLRGRKRIVKTFNCSGMSRRYIKIASHLGRNRRAAQKINICNID